MLLLQLSTQEYFQSLCAHRLRKWPLLRVLCPHNHISQIRHFVCLNYHCCSSHTTPSWSSKFHIVYKLQHIQLLHSTTDMRIMYIY
jgi:hypothetical protein